jgi:hypothetical protein
MLRRLDTEFRLQGPRVTTAWAFFRRQLCRRLALDSAALKFGDLILEPSGDTAIGSGLNGFGNLPALILS